MATFRHSAVAYEARSTARMLPAILGAKCGLTSAMAAAPRMALAASIMLGPQIGARYASMIRSSLPSRSTTARLARVVVAFHFRMWFLLPSSPAKKSKCG